MSLGKTLALSGHHRGNAPFIDSLHAISSAACLFARNVCSCSTGQAHNSQRHVAWWHDSLSQGAGQTDRSGARSLWWLALRCETVSSEEQGCQQQERVDEIGQVGCPVGGAIGDSVQSSEDITQEETDNGIQDHGSGDQANRKDPTAVTP
jgi:hypothetical protein